MKPLVSGVALARRLLPAVDRARQHAMGYRWYRSLHLAYVGWRARHGGLPRWRSIPGEFPEPDSATDAGSKSCKVLIATGTAGHLPSMTVESLLGMALSLRGAGTDFLLCDGALPACMMCEVGWYSSGEDFAQIGPQDRCSTCYGPSAEMLDDARLHRVGLSSQLTEQERQDAKLLADAIDATEIRTFTLDGIPLGEHAVAGALRFFARGDIGQIPGAEKVLRRYLESACLTYRAVRRLLERHRYDVVVLNHGIYVPQGIIVETARQLGIRVVTWHTAYRRGCLIFNHDETYHQGLLTEDTAHWEHMRWSDSHRDAITRYLDSRWVGRGDWIKFHTDPELDLAAIQAETGIDLSRPTVGLLTNVIWDAQLHYEANAFPDMMDWLVKTISYFRERPDLQLLIRIHPAELTGTLPSRQPAIDEIRARFPVMPKNIFIIPPQSKASTYVAMAHCDTVLIYGTKTGVELSASGKPVVVAGEAWVRGKGVTLDAMSESHYFELLDALPLGKSLDNATRDRARRYAYHFFFRRMIPVEALKERKGWPPFEISIEKIGDLGRGFSPGLDVICDGILDGTPFIYPAEEMAEAVERKVS